ncbi:hypothetical protein OF83DRAFT_1176751 [Amylostereum chailletii]|nr:hypothetical protein OF83DRAFT_1176751 [Amylostereum chailletii]
MAHDADTPERLAHIDDYQRYGRQMILDGFGLPGQLKLQHASVLVVGAGGLGCPALQYLAAAGVGRIGIVDHDHVELSNLHRQVLHTEDRVGTPKAESAAIALKQLNSRIQIDAYTHPLDATNANTLLQSYDLALDCTDNAPTRYLLSDTAARLRRPLVSGAAQQFSGQLCTYALGEEGPCYRCIFPRAPAPEASGSCEEVGVLGAVAGVVGTLQALEAVKILSGLHEGPPSLLIYSALSMPPFRSIKLRSRRRTCAACGDDDKRLGSLSDVDYVQFCGGARPDWETRGLEGATEETRIRAQDLKAAIEEGKDMCLVDVRPRTEFGICRLPGSIHVPLQEFAANPTSCLPASTGSSTDVYVVCRLGNDSQVAADALRAARTATNENGGVVKDLVGGLRAWARDVDPDFPVY